MLRSGLSGMIARTLNVFEAVNRDVPFAGLRWFLDHAETISPKNLASR